MVHYRPYRPAAAVIPPQPEAGFRASVLTYAHLMGWRTYYPYSSKRSTPGWPDLSLVRVRDGVGRLVLAELKSANGVVSATQQEWHDDLAQVPGIEVHIWTPADWVQIREVLA